MRGAAPLRSRAGGLLLPAISLLVIVISSYVRIRLINTPLERDEGEFAYTAQLLLRGVPPYVYAYSMKLPGAAMVYAAFLKIFGQSSAAVRIGLMIVNAASITLVYMLGRRMLGRNSAIMASAFFALLSLSQSVLGIFAHATHLVVVFSLMGILLFLTGTERRNKSFLFGGGICFGLAILMKQHATLLFIAAFLYRFWLRKNHGAHRTRIETALFLCGGVAPLAATALYLYQAGVFGNFWFWTFQYAREYATSLSLSDGLTQLLHNGGAIVRFNLPVWLLAGSGLIAVCLGAPPVRDRAFLLGYTAVSLAVVSPGLYFREHYFVLFLPAASLLAAHACTSAAELCAKRRPDTFTSLLPSLLLATALVYGCYSERDYLFKLSPLEVSRRVYGTNPFPEALQIAEYIRANSSKDDRIAILGSEPEILFYAGRKSATGHIYMYGLMEQQRYAEKMQVQLIKEIETANPAFIVVVNNPASWLLRANSLNKILEWGDGYIPLRYDEVGIIDIFGDRPTRYLWDNAAFGRDPEANSFVSVYRRRW